MTAQQIDMENLFTDKEYATLMVSFLEAAGGKMDEDDLLRNIHWAEDIRTGGELVDMLLSGTLEAQWVDGDMRFRVSSEAIKQAVADVEENF